MELFFIKNVLTCCVLSKEIDVSITEKSSVSILFILFSKTELLSDAYCIVGLIQFIEKVGIEKFYSHEKQFVQSVINRLERSDLKGNTYGKSSSYVDFFNKCWCGE